MIMRNRTPKTLKATRKFSLFRDLTQNEGAF